MSDFLINLVKKNKDDSELKRAYSDLSGVFGIICNLILFVTKLAVGALTASVSVTADAVNNFADSANNLVAVTGTRLSNKPVDKEHPFGHGRMEYVSALIVAVSIFVVSFELFKSSVDKIITPAEIKFSPWYIAVLLVTVLVKLYMAYFYDKLYKITSNLNLKAVRQDSLNDCIATLSTVAAVLVSHYLGFSRADGIIGVFVSVFIFVSGVQVLKDIISPLLGEAPPRELTRGIESIMLESEIVLGVHDLIVHSYGADKIIASAHAEVDSDEDIFTIHNVIDEAERKIFEQYGVVMCIHMDPVSIGDKETRAYVKKAGRIIKSVNPAYTFHDLRVVEREGVLYLDFDLVIPFEDEGKQGEIESELIAKLDEACPEVTPQINIEHSYI